VTGYDQIEHASATDVGVRRPYNQDAHAVLLASDPEQWKERGHIFLVADGMGAHAVGELASDLAAQIVPHTYYKHALEGPDPALRKAFIEANASIHARGQQNREFQGMGTTATALLVRPEGVWVGHVGDSRAYRIRDGVIEQLSFDHSLVWEMARRQKVNPDTLHGVPSNVIVRSLGPEPLVEVDVEGPHPLRPGDTFLLCSDGLSGQVSNLEIGAVATVMPPAEACRFLINLANLRGGPDNITVLIVRMPGTAGKEEPAEMAPPGRQGRSLLSHWPLAALTLAMVLAAAAAYLLITEHPGAAFAFWPAPILLIVGLIGLTLQFLQAQRQPPAPTERRPPKVYRPTSCQIDLPLVERMAQWESQLKEQVAANTAEINWTEHQQHHNMAEYFVRQGDLAAAFREYCRAMRPLVNGQ
jgi:protein phosphatase